MTEALKNEIILSLGNQIVDFRDDIAKTWETANTLELSHDMVIEFVQDNLGSIFSDFDGFDKACFSYEGWDYYETLKEQHLDDSDGLFLE